MEIAQSDAFHLEVSRIHLGDDSYCLNKHYWEPLLSLQIGRCYCRQCKMVCNLGVNNCYINIHTNEQFNVGESDIRAGAAPV